MFIFNSGIALSHWCIYHRKKAKQVVETWEKLFNSSQREQRVPFLYLANDILQNSRRKGSEFVHEFWKVLPAVLKDVYENGDDHGKNVVTRLVSLSIYFQGDPGSWICSQTKIEFRIIALLRFNCIN